MSVRLRRVVLFLAIFVMPATPAIADHHDFDGNGRDDLLWRNAQSGDVALWLMNGASVAATPVVFAGVPLALQIVGIGDFDGDGHADVLWRNGQDGTISVWLMNGANVVQSATISVVPVVWQTNGVADLNGDGRDDLVWRNTQNGDLAVWLMNGAGVLQGPVISVGVPLTWQVVGVGDLDADTMSDLVWRNSESGDVAVWLMTGSTVKQSAAIAAGVPLAWSITSLGDFNADARFDILWRNTQTGDVAMWLMNGAAVAQAPVVAAGVPSVWQIAGLRDVNADGRNDLLWRNTQAGDVAVWIMNGAVVTQQAVVAAGVPLAWQIQPTVFLQVPPPPSIEFGSGRFLVGSQIPAGRYYTFPLAGCYWERLSGLGGTYDEIIANDFIGFVALQSIVDILPTDRAFATDAECRTWFSTPRQGPQANIPPGGWLVGSQIMPGTYVANVQTGCYWERVRNFTNSLSAIIAANFVLSAGPQLVSISASDVGFKTDGECGTWTRVSAASDDARMMPLNEIEVQRTLQTLESRRALTAGQRR